MNRLSIYSIILAVLGMLFFILSSVSVGWNRSIATPGGPPPLTTWEVTLFYIFCGVGLLCFILSFVVGF